MSKAEDVIRDFLSQKFILGILLVRETELREWARGKGIGPTTLHNELKSLVSDGRLVKETKTVDGHYAVFYGLSSHFRKWWLGNLKGFREFVEQALMRPPESEKAKAHISDVLQALIGFVMRRFIDFVPFFVDYMLRNSEKLSGEECQKVLEDYWNWTLCPYMTILTNVCLHNREDALRLEIIRSIRQGYEEYYKTDYYKQLSDRYYGKWEESHLSSLLKKLGFIESEKQT